MIYAWKWQKSTVKSRQRWLNLQQAVCFRHIAMNFHFFFLIDNTMYRS